LLKTSNENITRTLKIRAIKDLAPESKNLLIFLENELAQLANKRDQVINKVG